MQLLYAAKFKRGLKNSTSLQTGSLRLDTSEQISLSTKEGHYIRLEADFELLSNVYPHATCGAYCDYDSFKFSLMDD